MPDVFVMRWKLDRPFLEADKSDDVYALLTIEPNPAAMAPGAAPPAVIPTHLILLVDVSGSMNVHRTDRKSTRLNSSHQIISYAVFCLKKKKRTHGRMPRGPRPCRGTYALDPRLT